MEAGTRAPLATADWGGTFGEPNNNNRDSFGVKRKKGKKSAKCATDWAFHARGLQKEGICDLWIVSRSFFLPRKLQGVWQLQSLGPGCLSFRLHAMEIRHCRGARLLNSPHPPVDIGVVKWPAIQDGGSASLQMVLPRASLLAFSNWRSGYSGNSTSRLFLWFPRRGNLATVTQVS